MLCNKVSFCTHLLPLFNVASENLNSRAIPERLGFTKEGSIRNYEKVNGDYHDRIIWILKNEWK